MRNLDLNLLRVLDALMAERNVTRAGERVGLSQPAVSRALGRLRHHFRDPLFVRNGGEMAPTARAVELSLPVRKALEQIAQAVGRGAAFDPAAVEGRIHIATADYMELVLLPAVMRRLAREAPGIEIVSRAATRQVIGSWLNGGRADLAFWPLALETGDLRSVPLLREEMVCIAASGHPAIRGELTLALYQSVPHVRVSPDGGGTSAIDNALAERGLGRRVGLVVASHAAAPRVVAETGLIATVPRRIARMFEGSADFRIWPLPLPAPGFTVDMVWPQRLDDNPLNTWIRGVVRDVANHL